MSVKAVAVEGPAAVALSVGMGALGVSDPRGTLGQSVSAVVRGEMNQNHLVTDPKVSHASRFAEELSLNTQIICSSLHVFHAHTDVPTPSRSSWDEDDSGYNSSRHSHWESPSPSPSNKEYDRSERSHRSGRDSERRDKYESHMCLIDLLCIR